MKHLVLVPVALALGLAGVARADSPYAVLTKPQTSWTYDVIEPRHHKPTGAKLTVTVSAVHTVGTYTVIELATSVAPAGGSDYQVPPMIIGPEGLHSPMGLDEDQKTHATNYGEDIIAQTYKDTWLPGIFLPGKLAKGSKSLKLDRFGQDDREYKVKWTLSKPDKHTWRVAWKGTYVVPEDPQQSRESYKASNDFDPDVGFTQICIEDGTCFKLAH